MHPGPGRRRVLPVATEHVLPGMTGIFGLPDIPVARTTCFDRGVRALPLRSTSTVHSSFLREYVAFVATVLPQ
jgi:hypothetical protein